MCIRDRSTWDINLWKRMMIKCCSSNKLLKPEPIRLKNTLIPNDNNWAECSCFVPTVARASDSSKNLSRLKSFYRDFSSARKHKIKHLLKSRNGVRKGLQELVLAIQELEWRQRGSWSKVFKSEDVPERPVNPMIKDPLFVRRECSEVYNTIELVNQ
eukprot:TRINITY_DN12990_c0_g4_i1.p1 TRINITY_DN12990_c0_g4~~TRINITY_DN12990_c0_g4_i1.p1  ORF type:complete len:157 (+),score=29.91 TRINITY_DN12990_c0_g4_i1:76-546(+)